MRFAKKEAITGVLSLTDPELSLDCGARGAVSGAGRPDHRFDYELWSAR